MEEEGRKRLRRDASGEVSGNMAAVPSEGEGESDSDDDIMAWLPIDEDSAGELMELLEPETTSPIKMKFIDNPYLSTLIFQSSASYVTINGNEESCGSSFSDSDASIMASIDMCSVRLHPVSACVGEFTAGSGGGWGLEENALAQNGDGFNGWDGFCLDDDSLARFLGEDLLLETLKNQE